MADQVNYYRVLGVSREASQEEIRSAYRRLAKERHPDHPSGSAGRVRAPARSPRRALRSEPPQDARRGPGPRPRRRPASRPRTSAPWRTSSQPGARSASRAAQPLGERLRGRFRRKEKTGSQAEQTRDVRRRGRYEVREARWYEPHNFDPEPLTWKSGAISFVVAFAAFIAAGQIGLWATGVIDAGPFAFTHVLGPFMPLVYTLVGLVTAYFAYRAAGYAALALVFVAALAVGGQGLPEGLLQFGTLGIVLLLVAIWLGNRRERAAR